MKTARVSIIAAVGKNRELGKGNELIWRISPDLKRVKELTTHHPIIMGRKTYESIGRPLPNRTNIVVSTTAQNIPGCIVCSSLEEGIRAAKALEEDEIFIFGGARIYAEALPYTDRLYLTVIDAEDSNADAFFPPYELFTQVIEEDRHSDHTPPFTWITLDRAS